MVKAWMAMKLFNCLEKYNIYIIFLKLNIYYILMLEKFINPGSTTYSIILFIVLMLLIQYFKPAFLYNQDGSYKVFGLGYRNRTVVPIWLIVFILAILSYLLILNLMNYNSELF